MSLQFTMNLSYYGKANQVTKECISEKHAPSLFHAIPLHVSCRTCKNCKLLGSIMSSEVKLEQAG